MNGTKQKFNISSALSFLFQDGLQNYLCGKDMQSTDTVSCLKVSYMYLSHSNPCFQSNIAITNFLFSQTCGIRFHDVIGLSTVHMYSFATILKHG